MNKFGQELKRLRLKKEMTQEDLAKILGVARSAVGLYEQGRREPDFETLEKIADFFNVDLDTLTGRGATKKEERQICELIERCHGDKVFEIVQKILKLDTNDRQAIRAMADSLLSTDKYKKGNTERKEA